jgi:glycosyltransferase involved in cell wall biosynthesis
MEVSEGAACLVAPASINDLTQSMITLLRDEKERQRLSSNGLNRARQFSWDRTAQLMLGVYREACERYEREKK